VTFGPERLHKELCDLGYAAERRTANDGTEFVVLPGFEVPLGRFAGRIIDLGIIATADFPRNVAPSIHVRALSQLLEIENIPNVRNVTTSALGPEWRYWSKNLPWPGERAERSAARLMHQINGIFENA
jgi:hypothetical protein